MLDKLIEYVSPKAAVKRQVARNQLSKFRSPQQRYDAAQRNHRTNSWRAGASSTNSLFSMDGERLRNVARELVRNNPHAKRGRQVIADGLIGPGVLPSIYLPNDKARRTKLESRLCELCDSKNIDLDGRLNLYGLQHLSVKAIVQDGEALLLRTRQSTASGTRLPVQIQAVECDHLDVSVNGPLTNGNYAVQGVEFNKKKKRVAYHIYDTHPSFHVSGKSYKSTRWLAENVCHLYDVERAGQARGISWYAPIALSLNDYRDYMDAQLVRQRIAASFAAFVKRVTNGGTSPLAANSEKSKSGEQLEAIEAGIIQYLDFDEDIVFGDPPSVDGVKDYSEVTLRQISVGLGVDYSALTGDYTGQNFAGGRVGFLRYQRTINAWFSSFVLPRLDEIGGWLLDALVDMGENIEGVSINWSQPVNEMYDPVKETDTSIKSISAGLTSRAHEQRKRNFDPELLDEEIKDSNDRADQHGLVFTSDARVKAGRLPDIENQEKDGEQS